MSGFGGMMVASYKVSSGALDLATPFDFYNPPQLVSASFNGTTQSLSSNSSVFTQTSDFTVEGWYYAANVTGTHYLFTLGTETSNRYSYFLSGNAITSNIYGSNSVSYSSTVSINTWNHIAVVRSGSTVSVYLNGNASATTDTQSGTIGTGNLRIGADSGGLNRFSGNISNFRLANSAIYTSTFTAPTSPLSSNVAVFFASLGSLPFTDYAGGNITITNIGSMILANSSPFAATWTDSLSGTIVANVATAVNSFGNPTYDARFGGGLNILQNNLTYIDVPTSYSGASGFTVSMAANIPPAQGSHYVAIYDGSVLDRAGQYINSRQWVGDGLEVGGQGVWGASNSTTDPVMGSLAWWDFVYNGRFVNVYKNGSLVTGFNNYDMGAGNQTTGWKNPLRFCGDDSIAAGNMMWNGAVYRIKLQATALDSTAITTQYNSIKSNYGLP